MHDDDATGRSWHDMGGAPAGPVEKTEHAADLFEKRVDALMMVCTAKGLFTVDGLRRALEEMGPDAFERMTYYERWMAAIARNLLEAGAFTADELDARMAQVAARADGYAAAAGGGHDA
jgi:hypothetical protein